MSITRSLTRLPAACACLPVCPHARRAVPSRLRALHGTVQWRHGGMVSPVSYRTCLSAFPPPLSDGPNVVSYDRLSVWPRPWRALRESSSFFELEKWSNLNPSPPLDHFKTYLAMNTAKGGPPNERVSYVVSLPTIKMTRCRRARLSCSYHPHVVAGAGGIVEGGVAVVIFVTNTLKNETLTKVM